MNAETGKAQQTEENKTDVKTNGGNCQEGKPKQRRKKLWKEINKGLLEETRSYIRTMKMEIDVEK